MAASAAKKQPVTPTFTLLGRKQDVLTARITTSLGIAALLLILAAAFNLFPLHALPVDRVTAHVAQLGATWDELHAAAVLLAALKAAVPLAAAEPLQAAHAARQPFPWDEEEDEPRADAEAKDEGEEAEGKRPVASSAIDARVAAEAIGLGGPNGRLRDDDKELLMHIMREGGDVPSEHYTRTWRDVIKAVVVGEEGRVPAETVAEWRTMAEVQVNEVIDEWLALSDPVAADFPLDDLHMLLLSAPGRQRMRESRSKITTPLLAYLKARWDDYGFAMAPTTRGDDFQQGTSIHATALAVDLVHAALKTASSAEASSLRTLLMGVDAYLRDAQQRDGTVTPEPHYELSPPPKFDAPPRLGTAVDTARALRAAFLSRRHVGPEAGMWYFRMTEAVNALHAFGTMRLRMIASKGGIGEGRAVLALARLLTVTSGSAPRRMLLEWVHPWWGQTSVALAVFLFLLSMPIFLLPQVLPVFRETHVTPPMILGGRLAVALLLVHAVAWFRPLLEPYVLLLPLALMVHGAVAALRRQRVDGASGELSTARFALASYSALLLTMLFTAMAITMRSVADDGFFQMSAYWLLLVWSVPLSVGCAMIITTLVDAVNVGVHARAGIVAHAASVVLFYITLYFNTDYLALRRAALVHGHDTALFVLWVLNLYLIMVGGSTLGAAVFLRAPKGKAKQS